MKCRVYAKFEYGNSRMTSNFSLNWGIPYINNIPVQIVVCSHVNDDGSKCGLEPGKYFKNLRTGEYMGFCQKHNRDIPLGWAAFKPVDVEEVITHEVMGS